MSKRGEINLRVLLIVSLTLLFSGCASTQHVDSERDPWQGFNRSMYSFNDGLDRAILKPAAKGYQAITPDFVEQGVRNFFSNLDDVSVAVNNLLQGKIGNAFSDVGRIVVNSTIGLLGLFDVASPMGLRKHDEDFGQTLGKWGAGSGPYLMLPFFGPRTVRSGVGYFVDTYTSIPYLIDNREAAWAFWTVEVVHYRATLLEADDLISGDRYIFLRDAYLQSRQTFLNGGVVVDDFSDFEEEEDWEEF